MATMVLMGDGNGIHWEEADWSALASNWLRIPSGNIIAPYVEATLAGGGLDLRELLSRPEGLTADEIETVRLERELEQARVDDLIFWYRIDSPSTWSRRREWNAIICWKPDGVTTNAYGPNRFSAVTNATDMLRARRSELEAAKAAEAEAQPEEPQQTICAECKHVAPGFIGMLTPLCAFGAKQSQITGLYNGPFCATKRGSSNPTEPCPDYEARDAAGGE